MVCIANISKIIIKQNIQPLKINETKKKQEQCLLSPTLLPHMNYNFSPHFENKMDENTYNKIKTSKYIKTCIQLTQDPIQVSSHLIT